MRTPPPEPTPRPRRRVTRGLADALVLIAWREDDLFEQAARVLGHRRGTRDLVRRILDRFPATRPPAARLVAFLEDDPRSCRVLVRPPTRAASRRAFDLRPPVMWSAPGSAENWDVPALTRPADLADWLGLPMGVVEALADLQGRGPRQPPGPLRNYVLAWRRKRQGGARLIEAPKSRLRAAQRRILDEILAKIPPHDAAHGFRPGRSIVSFAEPHVGRDVLVRMDLRDFFPSVSAARVVALFLTAGYPEPVARRLAGLCTNRVADAAWSLPGAPGMGADTWRARRLLRAPHLPQGAPSSPALANLAAHRLDTRLSALAETVGARYTRYADDLVFSGDASFARAARRFVIRVAAIVMEEGFQIHPRKIRIMRRGVRQHVAGVIVNQHINVPRPDFDRLKAILHNCARRGPASQNREGHPDFRAHLAGRVAHVEHVSPARGARLRAMLDAIDW